jgi:hypothetical protein
MKTRTILAIGFAFMAATGTRAQQNQSLDTPGQNQATGNVFKFDRVKINYLKCLSADNPGVVESALGHVTYMRIAFPKLDMAEIQKTISDLTKQGMTPVIRSKALLALQVFADPLSYQNAIASRDGNGDGLLEMLSGRATL